MPKPWDSLPLPPTGDTDEAKTYEGLGRAVSEWECVEFELARLYSIFAGDPDGDSVSGYGIGRISRERLNALRLQAAQYFMSLPHQALEGEFDRLCESVEGFSNRRNEFAHGIVMQVSGIEFLQKAFNIPSGTMQYACIPPVYAFRNQDEHGQPNWAYTYPQFLLLEKRLFGLTLEIANYRKALASR
jgi:hypothetical protein